MIQKLLYYKNEPVCIQMCHVPMERFDEYIFTLPRPKEIASLSCLFSVTIIVICAYRIGFVVCWGNFLFCTIQALVGKTASKSEVKAKKEKKLASLLHAPAIERRSRPATKKSVETMGVLLTTEKTKSVGSSAGVEVCPYPNRTFFPDRPRYPTCTLKYLMLNQSRFPDGPGYRTFFWIVVQRDKALY